MSDQSRLNRHPYLKFRINKLRELNSFEPQNDQERETNLKEIAIITTQIQTYSLRSRDHRTHALRLCGSTVQHYVNQLQVKRSTKDQVLKTSEKVFRLQTKAYRHRIKII